MKFSNRIKTIGAGLAFAVILTITGCSIFGSNPTAPTKTEQALFTVVTNYLPVVVQQTNTVTLTNVATVLQTNTIGQVQIVQATNYVNIPQMVRVTNIAPAYTLSTAPATTAAVQAVGSAINVAAPGIGSIVSMAILALLGGWGYLRGNKQGNTANALAQEIEAVRAFIKTLPNGTQLDTGITQFLQAHQLEAGVVQQVMDMLQKNVSNPDAQAAAKEISATVAALK
jgi:hypothetical protein